MYLHLSKKITLPNESKIQSLAYSDQNWIACGGDNGMLKVFKLENSTAVFTTEANSSALKISKNQTLEGHIGDVNCLTWNDAFCKLATSDKKGLVIVWGLHQNGVWYEEMMNNRNKSAVCALQWSRDGTKVCIAFADGVVTIGSVNGTKLWSKDVSIMGKEKLSLLDAKWVGNYVTLLTSSNTLLVYDKSGNRVRKMSLNSNSSVTQEPMNAQSIHFPIDESISVAPVAILLNDGTMILSRLNAVHKNERIIIQTGILRAKCQWSKDVERHFRSALQLAAQSMSGNVLNSAQTSHQVK